MEPDLRAGLPHLPELIPEPAGGAAPAPPPLTLYVHVPWCVRKCPYCDFNSHALRDDLPAEAYVDVLLADLRQEVERLPGDRPLTAIFIGGGTPSLLPGAALARLMAGVRGLLPLAPECEVTLEANPGTADAARFAAYRGAGVQRLSIGAQSLSGRHLKRLGRIHGPEEVTGAVARARSAGFDNLNLDLMYALPEQTLAEARADLDALLALEPEHVSYYQLTLEPNTAFHAAPPPLPDDDLAADIHHQGVERLEQAGYAQYEVSAYARPGRQCRHNRNYWEFGDYLGIGAGAHGKLTDPARGRVVRTAKLRHPTAYLDPANRARLASSRRTLEAPDLVLEFAMNALRLNAGFTLSLFEARTGLARQQIATALAAAEADGLLTREGERVRPTPQGRAFLNDLILRFHPG